MVPTKRMLIPLLLMMCLLIAASSDWTPAQAQAPRIAPDKAKDLVGREGVVFIDVRQGADWRESGLKIAGAVREDPARASSWMEKYSPEAVFIFYCA